jgi:quercetin dioxygenase-like cupin family protein
MTSEYDLKAIRRVVTAHDDTGRSIFRSDEVCTPTPVAAGIANFALIWTTQAVPADNNTDDQGAQREAGLTLKGGSVIRVVDFAPGARSPMHRSFSIDYGLVLTGQVDLQLDSGEIKHLHVGDIVIQRGTNHLWINRSSERWARMAFILIEAKPVSVDGKELNDHLL